MGFGPDEVNKVYPLLRRAERDLCKNRRASLPVWEALRGMICTENDTCCGDDVTICVIAFLERLGLYGGIEPRILRARMYIVQIVRDTGFAR